MSIYSTYCRKNLGKPTPFKQHWGSPQTWAIQSRQNRVKQRHMLLFSWVELMSNSQTLQNLNTNNTNNNTIRTQWANKWYKHRNAATRSFPHLSQRFRPRWGEQRLFRLLPALGGKLGGFQGLGVAALRALWQIGIGGIGGKKSWFIWSVYIYIYV